MVRQVENKPIKVVRSINRCQLNMTRRWRRGMNRKREKLRNTYNSFHKSYYDTWRDLSRWFWMSCTLIEYQREGILDRNKRRKLWSNWRTLSNREKSCKTDTHHSSSHLHHTCSRELCYIEVTSECIPLSGSWQMFPHKGSSTRDRLWQEYQ